MLEIIRHIPEMPFIPNLGKRPEDYRWKRNREDNLYVPARLATTVLVGTSWQDTSNGIVYPSPSFTPAAGDRLFCAIFARATTQNPCTMTDTQTIDWTQIVFQAAGTASLYVFRANANAAASSMTVTFDCTGDASTGVQGIVFRVSGYNSTVQSKGNTGSSGSANVTMDAAIQTANSVFGVASSADASTPYTTPSGWTQTATTSQVNPDGSLRGDHRDSGETTTTVSWGGTGAGTWGTIVVEVAGAAAGGQPPRSMHQFRSRRAA